MLYKKIYYKFALFSEDLYESKKFIISYLLIYVIATFVQIWLFTNGSIKIAGVGIDDTNFYIGWISIAIVMIGSPLVFIGAIYQIRLDQKAFALIIMGNFILMWNVLLISLPYLILTYLITIFIIVSRWKNWNKRNHSPTSLFIKNKHQRKINLKNFLIALNYSLLIFLLSLWSSEILIRLDLIETYKENDWIRWFEILTFSLTMFGTILINYKLQESFLIFSIMKFFSLTLMIYYGQILLFAEGFLWLFIDITSYASWKYKEQNNIIKTQNNN